MRDTPAESFAKWLGGNPDANQPPPLGEREQAFVDWLGTATEPDAATQLEAEADPGPRTPRPDPSQGMRNAPPPRQDPFGLLADGLLRGDGRGNWHDLAWSLSDRPY